MSREAARLRARWAASPTRETAEELAALPWGTVPIDLVEAVSAAGHFHFASQVARLFDARKAPLSPPPPPALVDQALDKGLSWAQEDMALYAPLTAAQVVRLTNDESDAVREIVAARFGLASWEL